MPKRKKHPRLPNGFGSIKYLGKGRRNPYGVYPPVTEFALNGSPVPTKALCYVDEWMVGFAVLTAWHAGTYEPGMELKLRDVYSNSRTAPAADDALASRLLADFSRIRGVPAPEKGKTFAEVYEEYYAWKYEKDHSRNYSDSARRSTQAAFKNCSRLHDREFKSIRYDELQAVVDECPLKRGSVEIIVLLLKQMYAYAKIYHITEENCAEYLKINIPEDDEHGVPFTDEDLDLLWAHQEDDTVQMLLIMCYSGYRITAYSSMEVNTDQWYFRGGVKNKSSKDRMVPIHSLIRPLVSARLAHLPDPAAAGDSLAANGNTAGADSADAAAPGGPRRNLLGMRVVHFRNRMYEVLEKLGIERHTPHDCRHTFSRLCKKYGVNELDRKKMLGHSFGGDITNSVYGHWDLEDLRRGIEKITR